MLPKNRPPTSPGDILKYEFLDPLAMTQQQLAEAIGVTRVRINEIISAKRGITPDTALRLARFFKTSSDFWLGLQMDYDTWHTLQAHKRDYDKIKPLKQAA